VCSSWHELGDAATLGGKSSISGAVSGRIYIECESVDTAAPPYAGDQGGVGEGGVGEGGVEDGGRRAVLFPWEV
jgi:hypothetical protein